MPVSRSTCVPPLPNGDPKKAVTWRRTIAGGRALGSRRTAIVESHCHEESPRIVENTPSYPLKRTDPRGTDKHYTCMMHARWNRRRPRERSIAHWSTVGPPSRRGFPQGHMDGPDFFFLFFALPLFDLCSHNVLASICRFRWWTAQLLRGCLRDLVPPVLLRLRRRLHSLPSGMPF